MPPTRRTVQSRRLRGVGRRLGRAACRLLHETEDHFSDVRKVELVFRVEEPVEDVLAVFVGHSRPQPVEIDAGHVERLLWFHQHDRRPTRRRELQLSVIYRKPDGVFGRLGLGVKLAHGATVPTHPNHYYNGDIMVSIKKPKPQVVIEAEVSVPSVWRGWGWPEHVIVKWSEDDVEYRLKGVMTDDGPVLAEAHMTGSIQPKHLRAPLMSVMRNAFAKVAFGQERSDGGYSKRAGMKVRVPVGTGRPVDPHSARQRLDELGRIWTKAPARQKTRTVADHFNISTGYAGVLITEARKKGFIE